MTKRPITGAVLSWFACFLTMTACGALWSVGGCTIGLHGRESTLTEGVASGAFIGLLLAWVIAALVYTGTDEVKFSDIDAQTKSRKEWS